VTDLRNGETIANIEHNKNVISVAFSPDSSRIATGYIDHIARVTDIMSGATIATVRINTSIFPVKSVAFSSDGSRLSIGLSDGTAQETDIRNGKTIATFSAIWSINKNKQVINILTDVTDSFVGTIWISPVISVAFSPDGSQFAIGFCNGTARVIDIRSGATIATFNAIWANDERSRVIIPFYLLTKKTNRRNNRVKSVSFSPDGSRLATGSDDGTVKVFDIMSLATIATVSHNSKVNSVAFSPDGSRLATGSMDKTALVTELSTGVTITTIEHNFPIYSVEYSFDGSKLVVAGSNGIAKIYDVWGKT